MNHSKEEIRRTVLDILAGREKIHQPLNQFRHLEHAVAEVFARKSGQATESAPGEFQPVQHLSSDAQGLLLEVFWDLFLDRVVTLGRDPINYTFPYFRLHSEAIGKI